MRDVTQRLGPSGSLYRYTPQALIVLQAAAEVHLAEMVRGKSDTLQVKDIQLIIPDLAIAD